MSVRDTIRAEIKRRIARGNEVDVSDDDSLLDTGVLDSAAVFELVQFVEKEFGVKVEDDEIVPEHFQSVTSMTNLVESKKK
jgi:acyl carrier protein